VKPPPKRLRAKRWKKPARASRCRSLFSLLNVPHVHQVHLFYMARLLDLDIEAGEESLEVKLFEEHEFRGTRSPSRPSARPCVSFFADRAAGSFGLHTGDIFRSLREG
jgi:hypothetical protein